MSAVAIDCVLAPLDGSETALDTAEYAAAIARQYDAHVHALYVVDPSIGRDIDAGDLDTAALAAETETFMTKTQELADAYDITIRHSTAYGFTTTRLTHHPGSVILDTAEEVDADFLVVPREPISGDPDEILGKAAEYVLMYASQPVLSV